MKILNPWGARLAVLLTATVTSLGWAAESESELPTYRAVYQVERNEKSRGTLEWTVTHDPAQDLYQFTSSLNVKGILRLALPNPVVERSVFRYQDGQIVPLEFWYEDGSRSGKDNLHLKFDWERSLVLADFEGRHTELELSAGIFDRGSIQVAAMLAMASPDGPGHYTLADGESFKVYDYARNGSTVQATPFGPADTQAYIRQRPGSSRRLLLWVAPELAFLPVRMEQQKNGQTDTVFILESVEGL